MEAHEVQVWSVAVTPSQMEAAVSLLDAEEIARADRFLVEHARANFVVARAALRSLAAMYLKVDPRSIQFDLGPQGKPSIPSSGLGFNISHSGELAVLGFTWEHELGVDVEKVRPMNDIWGVAERFFAPEEIADLRSVDPDDLPQAFFRCWTRKEAYIKAIGGGLSIPLDSFRVSLFAQELPAVISIREQPSEARHWSMYSWVPAPGYMAAVTIRTTKFVTRHSFPGFPVPPAMS